MEYKVKFKDWRGVERQEQLRYYISDTLSQDSETTAKVTAEFVGKLVEKLISLRVLNENDIRQLMDESGIELIEYYK